MAYFRKRLSYGRCRMVLWRYLSRASRGWPLGLAWVKGAVPYSLFAGLISSLNIGIVKGSSESLAGRISNTELYPFILPEVANIADAKKLWIRGGFPEPFLMESKEARVDWFISFIRTYVERELPLLGLNADPIRLNRLLSMLAFNQGQILNIAKLSGALGVTIPTVKRYLDFFEQSYFLIKLPPYFVNLKKRLIKSPKVYLRDSGVLHHILGLKSFNEVLGHPVSGNSWEGFVIQQVISYYDKLFDYSYYRTQDGTECDLVISKGTKVLACIEIKLTETPKVTRSFTISLQDLKPRFSYIIIPECQEPYKLNKEVAVCSLAGFFTLFDEIKANYTD